MKKKNDLYVKSMNEKDTLSPFCCDFGYIVYYNNTLINHAFNVEYDNIILSF